MEPRRLPSNHSAISVKRHMLMFLLDWVLPCNVAFEMKFKRSKVSMLSAFWDDLSIAPQARYRRHLGNVLLEALPGGPLQAMVRRQRLRNVYSPKVCQNGLVELSGYIAGEQIYIVFSVNDEIDLLRAQRELRLNPVGMDRSL